MKTTVNGESLQVPTLYNLPALPTSAALARFFHLGYLSQSYNCLYSWLCALELAWLSLPSSALVRCLHIPTISSILLSRGHNSLLFPVLSCSCCPRLPPLTTYCPCTQSPEPAPFLVEVNLSFASPHLALGPGRRRFSYVCN